MYRLCYLLLCLIFINCNGQIKNTNEIKQQDSLPDFIKDDNVLNFVKTFFIINERGKYVDIQTPTDDITILEDVIKDSIIDNQDKLKSFYNLVHNYENKNKLINEIDLWQATSKILEYPFLSDKSSVVYFEQIVFDIPEIKILFENYLVHPDQSWSSLDTQQSIKLFNDLVYFLIKSNSEKRLDIISKYYSKYKELQKKESSNIEKE